MPSEIFVYTKCIDNVNQMELQYCVVRHLRWHLDTTSTAKYNVCEANNIYFLSSFQLSNQQFGELKCANANVSIGNNLP